MKNWDLTTSEKLVLWMFRSEIRVDLKAMMVSMKSYFVISITLKSKVDIVNLSWLKP